MMPELLKFTPQDEQLLQETLNKRELLNFMRQGLEVVVYWLRQSNKISMSLTETNQTREFIIPNDSVLDAAKHPEFYAANAGMGREITRPYQRDKENDGA